MLTQRAVAQASIDYQRQLPAIKFDSAIWTLYSDIG